MRIENENESEGEGEGLNQGLDSRAVLTALDLVPSFVLLVK